MAITIGGKTPQSIEIGGKAVQSLAIGGEVVWSAVPLPDYFYIENAFDAPNSIGVRINSSPSSCNLEYSRDRINWQSWTSTTTLQKRGDRLYIRTDNGLGNSSSGNRSFYSQYNVNIGGDVFSLVDYTNETNDTLPEYALNAMCYNPSGYTLKVVDASNFTFKNIVNVSSNALRSMFYNISTLRYPPSTLSFKVGRDGCGSMFSGCTNLQAIPTLNIRGSYYHGVTLVGELSGMFHNCVSLTEVDLSGIANMPSGQSSCLGMFEGCTSLKKVTGINSQSSGRFSFSEMFKGCIKLNEIHFSGSSWDSSKASDWVLNVSATGDFYNLGGATLPTGTNGIPTGWNAHTTL